MIKIGICEWYLPVTGPKALAFAAKFGLFYIQIDLKNQEHEYYLGKKDIQKEYLRYTKEYNIQISSLAINSLNQHRLQIANKLTHAQKEFLVAVEGSTQLNCKLIFIPSFYENEIKTNIDFANTVDFYRWACDQIIDTDITLASENSLSSKRNLELVASVDRPNFKIIYDTFNPLIYNHNNIEMLEELWPHIAPQIHIKDGINKIPGEIPIGSGDANLEKIFTLLRQKNYDGLYILENKYNKQSQETLITDIKMIVEVGND